MKKNDYILALMLIGLVIMALTVLTQATLLVSLICATPSIILLGVALFHDPPTDAKRGSNPNV